MSEVFFEFVRLGGSVKVTALHQPSLVEVSVVCPAGASQAQMQAQALARLKYVLAKKAGQGG